MNYAFLGFAVTAVAVAVLMYTLERKRARRRSARPRFPLCFLAAALWSTAMFVMFPAGMSELQRPIILWATTRPFFLLGLALATVGLALPAAFEKPRAQQKRRPVPGKTLLAAGLLLLVIIAVSLYRIYAEGQIILFALIGAATALVVGFGLGPFIRKVKAGQHMAYPLKPIPLLLSSGLLWGGFCLIFASDYRWISSLSWFDQLRVSQRGSIAMEAFTLHGSGFVVSDLAGENVVALEKRLWPRTYAQWSRDGQTLYLCRRLDDNETKEGELFRYTLADGSLVRLRQMPHEVFRLSPDGSKIVFRRRPEDESSWRCSLVCGATDNEENDTVICDNGPGASAGCWGPSSRKFFFASYRDSSFPDREGLWSVRCSGDTVSDYVLLLPGKIAVEVACNADETFLAILSFVGAAGSQRPILEVVDLAMLTAKKIPLEGDAVNLPWEDELVWGRSGRRLAFEDGRALKVYDTRTRNVQRLVEAGRSTVALSYDKYERLMPVTWLSSKELLFLRNRDSFRIYDFDSRRVRESPLAKRIRKWLKKH